MSAVLLIILAGVGAGPHAQFWSGGRTYLIDAATSQLYVAPGYYASSEGDLYRYQLRTTAKRRRADIPAPASRWTHLERVQIGHPERIVLTPSVEIPPGLNDSVLDERTIVQFDGTRVSLVRNFRQTLDGETHTRTELEVFKLPMGDRVHQPTVAMDAAWFERHLPGLIDPCVRRPIGRMPRTLPGGQQIEWLVMAGDSPECAGDVHVLSLNAHHPPKMPIGLQDFTAIIDARAIPSGGAILLRGDPIVEARTVLINDLQRVENPCAQRAVWHWTGVGQPTRLGPVARLGSFRWLTPDDPILAARGQHFLPVDATCYAPLRLSRHAEPTSALSAHRCRIEETDRAWAGSDDLMASAGAVFDAREVVVRVRVFDPIRRRGDQVRLWFGDRRRHSVIIDRAGTRSGNRRRAAPEGVRAAWREERAGYEVLARLPRKLVGSPPAITIRIDDSDPQGVISLWVAGTPIDRRHRSATPTQRIDQ